MRKIHFTFCVLAALAAFASSARADYTVQLYLTTVNATPTGGTWQLYMNDSLDNDGITSFDVEVLGSGGAVVNSPAILQAPRPNDISNQYADGQGGNMGFNSQVSSGSNSGTGRVEIHANQTIVYGNNDDPSYDMGILVGVGQEPSSASPQNGTQGPIDGSGSPTGIPTPIWNWTPLTTVSGGVGAPSYQIAGTLMEQGTYTTADSLGFLSVDAGDESFGHGFINVLRTADNGFNEPWGPPPVQPGNAPFALVSPETIALPEPTSLGLLAIGIAILSTRRRHSRPHRIKESN